MIVRFRKPSYEDFLKNVLRTCLRGRGDIFFMIQNFGKFMPLGIEMKLRKLYVNNFSVICFISVCGAMLFVENIYEYLKGDGSHNLYRVK